MPRHHEFGLETRRQSIGPEIDDARHFIEAHALAAGIAIDDDTASDIELLRIGLQDRGRRREHVVAQRLAGLPRRLAADAGGARRPGAAAVRRVVGIASDDAHPLNRHAERRGDDLRKNGLGALPLFGDAGLADHGAGSIELQRRAVLRGDARAADAVEGRRRIGHFDEGGKADAAMNAARAQLRLLGAQRLVIHHLENLIERRMMRQAFEFQARGAGRRIGIIGKKIAPPQLRRIHADLERGLLDQAFGHRGRDRMADRAVLAHDILILEHDAGAGAIVRAQCKGRRPD